MLYRFSCIFYFADSKPNFTIVTALYDLGRETWPSFKRRFTSYLNASIQMLRMNVPLVVYVEPELKPFIDYYRAGKEDYTFVKAVPFHKLRYYSYVNILRAVMSSDTFKRDNGLLNHPEGFSAEYNILMSSKLQMLFTAVKENVFDTEFFFWMDIGYAHGQDVYPKTCNWAPNNLMLSNHSDKITYMQMNAIHLVKTIHDVYKQAIGPCVNGGFFGGSGKAVVDYYYLYDIIFRDYLKKYIVDDDQTLAVGCYLERPELFNLVKGADWYDVFKVFN